MSVITRSCIAPEGPFHGLHTSHSPHTDDESPRVRVRFAPSPTGFMHLGGLRTALYNYLFAKQHGGDFLLRIEDTDQSRLVPGSLENLVEALEWAGMHVDEGPGVRNAHTGVDVGPYVQSQRTDLYRAQAQRLLDEGHAYRCFCTQERLDRVRAHSKRMTGVSMYDRACLHLKPAEISDNLAQGIPYTVRLHVKDGSTVVHDRVYGRVRFDNDTLDDQVLLKSDNHPTYHLANVVDDHLMGITHVIRGSEWMSSTPKHLILYELLGWEPPEFAHLPVLVNKDRQKLSKRHEAASVDYYRQQDLLPSAVVNYVALLGWNAGDDKEVFDLDELVEAFSLDRVHRAPAGIDMEKLQWLNQQHVRRQVDGADDTYVRTQVVPLWQQSSTLAASAPAQDKLQDLAYCLSVASTIKERVVRTGDFDSELAWHFFAGVNWSSQTAQDMRNKHWGPDIASHVQQVASEMAGLSDDGFTHEALADILRVHCKTHKLKFKTLAMALRYATTGVQVGASITHTMETLKRDECLLRIQQALDQQQQ